MRGWLPWCTAVVAHATFLMGCTSLAPPQAARPVAVAEPIRLGPSGSRSLTFLHVVERIPAGTLLGVARWEGSGDVFDEIRAKGDWKRSKSYNVAITDLLRAHGYDVRDEADAVFDAGRAVRVRYQVAGVVHDADINYVYRRRRRHGGIAAGMGIATVRLELQVYDAVRKQLVFQNRYDGTGSDEGTEPNPVVPAVVAAVKSALADPDFVAAVAAAEPGATSEAQGTTTVARCTVKASALPADMDELLDSVVTVRAGGELGGGFILSEDGHVITAAHVIGDSAEIFVTLRSGPTIPARVVSRDAGRDLALLELPGHGYRCAPTTASPLAIGSEVFAINLLLDENTPTVSRGVVSGYQEIDGRRYIQTDASINPGSSGGPLFDGAGRVGGIVTRKIMGFGLEGLGLGVPIEDVDPSLQIKRD